MSALARRAAFQATRTTTRTPLRAAIARRGYAENPAGKNEDLTGDPAGEKKVNLAEGAKRDPELYVRHPTHRVLHSQWPRTAPRTTNANMKLACYYRSS